MGYLFVHFTGEQKDGEQIYFSLSRDGLSWQDCNAGRPVLYSHIGERGVRDPFLVTDDERRKYYLIATDLRIEAGKGWKEAEYHGSRDIIVWESQDLIHWSKERSCRIGVAEAGCVWAPESIYDREKKQFFVFWASMVQLPGEESPKQRIYGSYTKDFRDFTEPFIYCEAQNHLIDMTIVEEKGWYYRFIKDETTKKIRMDRSRNLAGNDYEEVAVKALADLYGVEGPECYPLADGRWCLIVDRFAEGKGYLPFISSSLEKGDFEMVPSGDFHMGRTMKRHGGVLQLTKEEYDRIMEEMYLPFAEAGEEEPAYLFVHFREKTTPDGEQVYFGLSKDGFHWETVNDGQPVLWAYYGDKGVRDFTIVRCEEKGRFYIFATDLSLSYGMRGKYHHSWEEIGRNGSRFLAVWESEDLVNWSEQRLIPFGEDELGCRWAPDILYDPKQKDYILHWSSPHVSDGYKEKAIFYSRTKDFKTFTSPSLLYRKADSGVIDSAMYEENGSYYLFVKSEKNPCGVILLRAENATGPFEKVEGFEESTDLARPEAYEAPTAVRLADGRWCLFLDYMGEKGKAQGYVPFTAERIEEGRFVRADEKFSFPYGFKHGTILKITRAEYERVRGFDWSEPEDLR